MADQIPPSADIPYAGSTDDGGIFAFLGITPQEVFWKFIAVLIGAAIVVGGIFAVRYTKKKLLKLELAHEQQRMALNLFEKLTSGFIIVLAMTTALKVIGIDMSLLVSVSILGLSYGLQDVIKNYVAGILILFKAPFRIGDTIKIRDYTGKVEKIDFQSTTLRTFDRRNVTIYNSDVMTQSIVNFSNTDIRRIELDVQVGYGSNTIEAFKIFDHLLKNNNNILKSPTYKIVFKRFTDSGIEFTLRGWVKMPANLLGIKSEIAMQISNAFDEKNIFMPYSKGIETDGDYTMTPDRQTRIQALLSSPPLATEPATDPNLIPEAIDFDEAE